jgi:hypothetical protein
MVEMFCWELLTACISRLRLANCRRGPSTSFSIFCANTSCEAARFSTLETMRCHGTWKMLHEISIGGRSVIQGNMPKSSSAFLLRATGKFAQTYHVGLFDLATILSGVSIGFEAASSLRRCRTDSQSATSVLTLLIRLTRSVRMLIAWSGDREAWWEVSMSPTSKSSKPTYEKRRVFRPSLHLLCRLARQESQSMYSARVITRQQRATATAYKDGIIVLPQNNMR